MAMSPEELATRAGRQLRSGVERIGLVRGGSDPEPQWLAGGLKALPLPTRPHAGRYVDAAEQLRRGNFSFFGRRFELGIPPDWNTDPLSGTTAPLVYGKTLDYRDARVVGDAKHLWELNRHLELVTLAQAYRLTDNGAYLETMRELLSSWIDACPYPKGANWCSALEPAIRLINWHLAYCIAGGPDSPLFAGAQGRQFREKWLRSIFQHDYFIMSNLSTYPSSANNHLIGELAGVFVSCCTWPCWPECEKWKDETWRMLHREIRRQTHGDGVNKEQTTWYQQFVASLFIVAAVAGRRAGMEFDPEYWETVARMLEFVSGLMDVSGHVPMIGDADEGLAFALEPREGLDPFRSLLGIGAALFGDPLWRKQSRGFEDAGDWLCAGLDVEHSRKGGVPVRTVFADGGYYVLGRELGTESELRATVDAGPLGFPSIAAHGHADCLSMTLSVAGREQLVDPGTYAYHTDRQWRDYFRGTSAHNTVRVDGQDQSESGGPFLWTRKAECTVESVEASDSLDVLSASHDGYLRLRDPVRHAREIRFDKPAGVIEVIDRIACRGRHEVERFWHFAELCDVGLTGTGAVSDDGAVRLFIEVDDDATTARLRRGSTDPIGGWISRRFGWKTPTITLVLATDVTGDAALRTRIRVETLS